MECKTSNRLAVAGIVLSVPALIIVAAGILEAGFGLREINNTLDEILLRFPGISVMIHPAIVIGGLIISLAINAIPVVRIRLEAQAQTCVATITAHRKIPNIAAALLSSFLLAALMCYAFGENFRIVSR